MSLVYSNITLDILQNSKIKYIDDRKMTQTFNKVAVCVSFVHFGEDWD